MRSLEPRYKLRVLLQLRQKDKNVRSVVRSAFSLSHLKTLLASALSFSRLLQRLLDDLSTGRQVVVIGEVGEKILAVSLRH
jgi:hypothetical protein